LNIGYQRKNQLVHQNGVRDKLLRGFSINKKMAVIGVTCPAYLPPYSTVFWDDKQWRAEGAIYQIMKRLHQQVRKQVKKT
jgi:hypothetical protein